MSVDLAAAKAHLNITSDLDDALLERLIPAARDYAQRWLGYEIAGRYPSAEPPSIDQAMLMLIGHWYDTREGSVVGVSTQAVPFGVTDILAGYRDYSFGEVAADE